jgi:hypothetical protein
MKGAGSMKAIFIGGCSRSGTTLLGSMLGLSPGVVCTPESQFKTEILEKGNPTQILQSPEAALHSIVRHWRFSLWNLHTDRLKELVTSPPSSYQSVLERLVHAYAQDVDPKEVEAGKETTWVDHSPSNLQYLDRLFTLFPDAVAIHLVRDGRAVAASVMPLDWGPNTAYFAARWWARNLAHGLAAESFFGPEKVLRVRYEDILIEPSAELKRICRFAGVEYDEKMPSATGFQVPLYTTEQHRWLLTGKVAKGRAAGWRQVLTEKQVALFEASAGDLLTFLGYDRRYRWPARPSNALLAKEGAVDLLYRLMNYLRKFRRKRRFVRVAR